MKSSSVCFANASQNKSWVNLEQRWSEMPNWNLNTFQSHCPKHTKIWKFTRCSKTSHLQIIRIDYPHTRVCCRPLVGKKVNGSGRKRRKNSCLGLHRKLRQPHARNVTSGPYDLCSILCIAEIYSNDLINGCPRWSVLALIPALSISQLQVYLAGPRYMKTGRWCVSHQWRWWQV